MHCGMLGTGLAVTSDRSLQRPFHTQMKSIVIPSSLSLSFTLTEIDIQEDRECVLTVHTDRERESQRTLKTDAVFYRHRCATTGNRRPRQTELSSSSPSLGLSTTHTNSLAADRERVTETDRESEIKRQTVSRTNQS